MKKLSLVLIVLSLILYVGCSENPVTPQVPPVSSTHTILAVPQVFGSEPFTFLGVTTESNTVYHVNATQTIIDLFYNNQGINFVITYNKIENDTLFVLSAKKQ